MSSKKVSLQRPENAFYLYTRLLSYVRQYWVALIIAIVGSIAFSGIDAWFVYFLKPLLNHGLVHKNQHFLTIAPFLVLGAFSLRGIASFLSNYFIAYVSRNVMLRLRQDLFQKCQRLPAAFYDHATTGQMVATLTYSVEQIANAGADVLTNAVQAFFLIIGLLIVMFSMSWKLSLLYFVLIPIIVVIMRITSLRVRRLALSIQQSIADMTHRAEENISGYKMIRLFGGETIEINKFDQTLQANRRSEMKVVSARAWSVSSVQCVAAIALAVTLYIAAHDIAQSILSPGGFIAMAAAMLALIKPMKDLTTMQNKLYRGLAGAETVFKLLDQPDEEDRGTKTLVRARGDIEFSKVHFAYHLNRPVLKGISFHMQPGKIFALVGRSGSGKTTLTHLLPRFYSQFTGDILLDGISIRDYRLADLRRQFAYVSQHITLLNDTVWNNIAYGITHPVTDEDLYRVTKAAYAYDFINALPNGFHTLLGENGVRLSGGQRQRIAIARAMLKNAPILILDEATASLDMESERSIQLALKELMQHCTTLVIAHRLSTVEHADCILVMDQGEIVETGKHADLLINNGLYAQLYQLQFQENDVTVCEH